MKKDFLEYMKKEFNFNEEEIKKFEESLKKPLKKSIRINTNKISVEEFKKIAKKNNWILTETSMGKNTFYIDRPDSKKVALGNTFLHLAGYFYVQELAASSSPFFMSLDKIDENPYLILDMSASPGGKSTQLAEYYKNSLIVANELDKSRLKGFFSNLDRMSALNVVATNYDGRFFKQVPEIFDKVLLDAPCSGEGTAFKTDDALKYWNLKNIKTISKLQFGLLESALKTCKVGGEIVYSTCTLNKLENEKVIEKLLKKYSEFIEIIPIGKEKELFEEKDLSELEKSTKKIFQRNWPHLTFTGGFFVAKIKKTKSLLEKQKFEKNIKTIRQNISKVSSSTYKKIEKFFLDNFDFDIKNYYFYEYNGEIQMTNRSLSEIWDKIFLYKIGVNIGQIKNQEFVPNFYAGIFKKFKKNILELEEKDLRILFDGYELDSLDEDGYYQLVYKNLAIGLVKIKNGKVKNL